MTGLLSSYNIHANQERVRQSLSRVNPVYHLSRMVGAEQHINPIPYHADYFGHKIHYDQNEKLVGNYLYLVHVHIMHYFCCVCITTVIIVQNI